MLFETLKKNPAGDPVLQFLSYGKSINFVGFSSKVCLSATQDSFPQGVQLDISSDILISFVQGYNKQ